MGSLLVMFQINYLTHTMNKQLFSALYSASLFLICRINTHLMVCIPCFK